MATLEEEHSTRGRAHMLFELLQGEVVRGGWKDEHVKKAMDLCLSCKACKSECPTNVDVATYKAEFLAHYYEDKSRPLHAYAFGMIDRWAELGSSIPWLANFFSQAPGFRHITQAALHLAPQRRVPRLAGSSFQAWACKNRIPGPDGANERAPDAGLGKPGAASGPEVILWADTFNNYFHPETSRAALGVLQAAGFRVSVPQTHLCCGRPLYDFGMLDRAKQYLEQIMSVLSSQIEAGVPIVVLEPSCASVFRDELRNLFPTDTRATRLRSQVFLLSEFLEHHAPNFQPPRLAKKILLHGHCHHKSLMRMTDEESVLLRTGAELQSIDSGCCGMAGPFGFEKDKYAVSQAVGERVLLPAVRNTPTDALIVSDGFSCREQILQSTGRRAIHLAEALQLGLRSKTGSN
jgi:Fe-S oxidoreductase